MIIGQINEQLLCLSYIIVALEWHRFFGPTLLCIHDLTNGSLFADEEHCLMLLTIHFLASTLDRHLTMAIWRSFYILFSFAV